MAIHNEYNSIISKCVFYSKRGNWFLSGSNCILESILFKYERGDLFYNNTGLFRGITDRHNGKQGIILLDGETCPFDEFFIVDKNQIEISNFSLSEYLQYVRDKRIDDLLK